MFNVVPSQNLVSWNVILAGFAMHGHGKEALEHFEQMCKEGIEPDDITFVCVLSACSHAGLVDEGMQGLWFHERNLQDSCKIGALHLHG